MKCGKIRKMILTDYIDGELDPGQRKVVEDHIRSCPRCGELLQIVRDAAVDPLKRAERLQPPEETWHGIKGVIEANRPESPLSGLRERLREILAERKPAFAVLTASILIVIAALVARTYLFDRASLNMYLEEQLSFIDALNNGDRENGSYTDIGIPMEDFLL
ncbi:MAG: zf-HC2 domain-containing protein [Candidatus Omnitrophota bacterium]|nr:zf-HC2 domain-containing protein [Candidatus Omnitrophota bacterium]